MRSTILTRIIESGLAAMATILLIISVSLLLTGCGGGSTQQPTSPPTPPPPSLTITTLGLPSGVIETPYDQSIQVSGGVAPFSWTLIGTLPHNLSLSSGTTNQVTISGTPDTAGHNAAFSVQVKDSAHQLATQAYNISILLQANAVVLSPANLDFGSQVLGSASKTLAATLTNNANSDVAITAITISGANTVEFNQTSTCGTVLIAGASCTLNLSFNPAQPGPRSATLLVSDDVNGGPQGVSLNGVGLASGSNATLSELDLPFGTQLVGTTSPPWPVALTNYGTLTLNITSIAANGGFAETDDCVSTVAPLASCTLKVTFAPAQAGQLNGSLSLLDDAAGSPQIISLSGNGSSNTPLLTGSCFETCVGRSQDPAACPVGAPSISPGKASVYPCGPVGGEVPVDGARKCLISGIHYGHCVTQ